MGASSSKPELKRDEAESLEDRNTEESEGQFCQLITKDEYDDQRLMGTGGTKESIKDLLDKIINDSTLTLEFRLEKLKKFKVEYPFVFREKRGDEAMELIKIAIKEKKKKEANCILS